MADAGTQSIHCRQNHIFKHDIGGAVQQGIQLPSSPRILDLLSPEIVQELVRI